ncbi:MAG: phosphoenolpyruvate carboxylase [Hyphomicrobiales bacterium]
MAGIIPRSHPRCAALAVSSWIGNDRDGNPFVTVETTRRALAENRAASVERLDGRLAELARLVSVSAFEISVPESPSKQALEMEMQASGDAEGICGSPRNCSGNISARCACA